MRSASRGHRAEVTEKGRGWVWPSKDVIGMWDKSRANERGDSPGRHQKKAHCDVTAELRHRDTWGRAPERGCVCTRQQVLLSGVNMRSKARDKVRKLGRFWIGSRALWATGRILGLS